MTRSPEARRSSVTAVAITLGSALIVATCSMNREHAPAPVAPPAPSEAAPVVAPAPSAPAPVALPVGPKPRTAGHELDNFFDALRGLEKHTRAEHVRMFWLGDSHGASDLWSGPVRAAFQKRFGDGGPGFVHVGYKAWRHDLVRIETKGSWHVRPRGPSTTLVTGDGVFGLGGVLAGGYDGGKAVITLADPALPAKLTWDFCYKLGGARDEVELQVSGAPAQTIKATGPDPIGGLTHVVLQSSGSPHVLHASPTAGAPEFCGVTAETDPKTQPGVVLDILGINGARLATPLAWNEAAWVAELTRRHPSLAIFEYGTNEAGDHTIRAEAFAANLVKVLARVRSAAPACDCLVLSNTERADAQETTPEVREALRGAARASGCMFWDTYAVMGGKGGILSWRAETQPRAGPDGIHLTGRGYRELGDKLASNSFLLAAFGP